MSSSSDESAYGNSTAASEKKYKGIRRRKWGKWVSEIRVPGTPERLWLGSYATPEAAAVARDVAFYCLRGDASPQSLNFPLVLPAGARVGMSPRSVQRAASDAGLAIDARLIDSRNDDEWAKGIGGEIRDLGGVSSFSWRQNDGGNLNVSVEDYM